MIIPRITKPYEPGLPALGNDLENYLVSAGGSVTIKLEPGDNFKIINVEGHQQAELVSFNSKGECSLSPLCLKNDHNGDRYISKTTFVLNFTDKEIKVIFSLN